MHKNSSRLQKDLGIKFEAQVIEDLNEKNLCYTENDTLFIRLNKHGIVDFEQVWNEVNGLMEKGRVLFTA